MVHKVLLWTGFGNFITSEILNHYATDNTIGLVVRFVQLGIEMRPFFHRTSFYIYPIFGAAFGSIGYWLQGVEDRQIAMLTERREELLRKRQRRAERLEDPVMEGDTVSGPPASGVLGQ